MKTALVVAAHPDDEVLGCGGTIAQLAEDGWDVHILIMAEGATSRAAMRDAGSTAPELDALAQAAEAARRILGAASVTLHGFPDNRMDGVNLLDVVKVIEDRVRLHLPSLVLTHGPSDVNVDHQRVHEAALAACRPLPDACVRELLFFEIASSTEWRPASSRAPFGPALYYDIERQIDRKRQALEAYASELRAFPHPRSVKAVEALAVWRGACSGHHAAEAFSVGFILRSPGG